MLSLSARYRGKVAVPAEHWGRGSKAQSLVRANTSPSAAGTKTPPQPHSHAKVLSVHTEADTQTPASLTKLLCSCMCRRCKQSSQGVVGPACFPLTSPSAFSHLLKRHTTVCPPIQDHAQPCLSAKYYSLKPYLKFKLYFSDKTLISDIDLLADLGTLLFSCPFCQGKDLLHLLP